MIFIDESFSKEVIQKLIENEKIELNRKLQAFQFQKKTLVLYTKSITSTLEKIEYFDNTQKLSDLFSSFKLQLEKMRSLESTFPKVSKILEKTNIKSSKEDLIKLLYKYNSNLENLQKDLDIFSDDLSNFIQDIQGFVEFKFLDSYTYEEKNDNSDSKINFLSSENTDSNNENQSSIPVYSDGITDNNCLIISEIKDKVFLPYKIKNLNEKLSASSKYSNISEIIENEYILPLSKYKNPILSRFKETYNLMKNKEKSSFLEALDLTIELSLNSTLNPAVITACQNKTELDIYLDCLYENELEKFKIFDIKYEINPTIKGL